MAQTWIANPRLYRFNYWDRVDPKRTITFRGITIPFTAITLPCTLEQHWDRWADGVEAEMRRRA